MAREDLLKRLKPKEVKDAKDILKDVSGADSVIKSYHQDGEGGRGFDSDRNRAHQIKVPNNEER